MALLVKNLYQGSAVSLLTEMQTGYFIIIMDIFYVKGVDDGM